MNGSFDDWAFLASVDRAVQSGEIDKLVRSAGFWEDVHKYMIAHTLSWLQPRVGRKLQSVIDPCDVHQDASLELHQRLTRNGLSLQSSAHLHALICKVVSSRLGTATRHVLARKRGSGNVDAILDFTDLPQDPEKPWIELDNREVAESIALSIAQQLGTNLDMAVTSDG